MEDKTIEKVDFSIEELETNYYECTFDKCNFSDKPIGRVIFEKCTFKECNLSLVKTSNTSWLDVLFTDCKMTGINFSLSNRFGLSVEFHNCLLSYALFTEMKLKGTRFIGCDLQNTDFMETDLSNAVFKDCDQPGESRFHYCTQLCFKSCCQPSEKSEVLPLRTGRVAYRIRNRSCRLTSPCITWE